MNQNILTIAVRLGTWSVRTRLRCLLFSSASLKSFTFIRYAKKQNKEVKPKVKILQKIMFDNKRNSNSMSSSNWRSSASVKQVEAKTITINSSTRLRSNSQADLPSQFKSKNEHVKNLINELNSVERLPKLKSKIKKNISYGEKNSTKLVEELIGEDKLDIPEKKMNVSKTNLPGIAIPRSESVFSGDSKNSEFTRKGIMKKSTTLKKLNEASFYSHLDCKVTIDLVESNYPLEYKKLVGLLNEALKEIKEVNVEI